VQTFEFFPTFAVKNKAAVSGHKSDCGHMYSSFLATNPGVEVLVHQEGVSLALLDTGRLPTWLKQLILLSSMSESFIWLISLETHG
jgi:hypothetical protein